MVFTQTALTTKLVGYIIIANKHNLLCLLSGGGQVCPVTIIMAGYFVGIKPHKRSNFVGFREQSRGLQSTWPLRWF